MRALMIAGLAGDGVAYRTLLSELSGHLRAYYGGRLVRAGRGTEEVEDLVQEALIAVHARRHTYDPTQLLTPWVSGLDSFAGDSVWDDELVRDESIRPSAARLCDIIPDIPDR